MVGAEFLGQVQPDLVTGGAGDDDHRRSGLLAGHYLGEPLLSRSLNEHRVAVPNAGGAQRPLDSVGQRRHQAGELGGDRLRHPVQHRVPWQVHVLTEAPPQAAGIVG